MYRQEKALFYARVFRIICYYFSVVVVYLNDNNNLIKGVGAWTRTK